MHDWTRVEAGIYHEWISEIGRELNHARPMARSDCTNRGVIYWFRRNTITTMLDIPRDLVQSFADVRLPSKTDSRLQSLMDRNTERQLTPQEREDLESLVELSEILSLLRARAMQVLSRQPI